MLDYECNGVACTLHKRHSIYSCGICGLKKASTMTFACSKCLPPESLFCCLDASRSFFLQNDVRMYVGTRHIHRGYKPHKFVTNTVKIDAAVALQSLMNE